MISALKFLGMVLLVLVGYHYINEPLGFSIGGSIATALFGLCLTLLYRPYQPEAAQWIGWGLIAVGCLFIAGASSLSWLLLIPALMVITGYRLTALPFELKGGDGAGGLDSDGGGWGCDGGGDGGGD